MVSPISADQEKVAGDRDTLWLGIILHITGP